MTDTLANTGKLTFSTKPKSIRRALSTLIYTALTAVTILFGARMLFGLGDERFQTLLAIAASLLFASLIDCLAGRATTKISISNDRMVIQSGGVVSASFLLSEVTNIECSPSLLGSMKITTKGNLVFRIPIEGLATEDRSSLHRILGAQRVSTIK